MSEQAPALRRRVRARGFSMIEVLITLVVIAFGLLGLSGFVTRATAMSIETGQRARAAALLEDMQFRVANNKLNLASYATGVTHGAAEVTGCAGLGTLAARDLCQWNNLLVGTHEALGAGATAQALTFRGCITQPNPAQPVIVITVTWAATMPGIPPADNCAAGTFGDDSFRRILRSQVRVAALAA
jgi:type IV pilus assembly protein PilV